MGRRLSSKRNVRESVKVQKERMAFRKFVLASSLFLVISAVIIILPQPPRSVPEIVGMVSDDVLLSYPYSIYTSDNYAYVVGATSDSLVVLDISVPENIAIISSVTDSRLELPTDVFVQGDYAYVAAFEAGMIVVVNISSPEAPTISGSVSHEMLRGAQEVYVEGDYAYVTAYGSDALVVVEISDPENPIVTGYVYENYGPSWDPANCLICQPVGIQVQGDYAFINSTTGDEFVVVDVSDPYTPSFVTKIRDERLDWPEGMWISGDYAYVVTYTDDFTVVDISDPSDPWIVGSVTDNVRLDGLSRIQVVGDLAYVTVADGGGIAVVNVSDPSSPSLVSYRSDKDLKGAMGLSISGDYGYVCSSLVDKIVIFKLI